ncbi:Helicase-like:Type III restriction enzyme, res subunit:DEAD/DEAH box helicase-like [Olavius algarvensis associated proteobacterium Delta 3]|nr:Helicase-like:Type III restriction enzyme, res subunit:DEAD/DEAH box helicase-like [Olavius algarvensis associated proteobacterium Delta 3]
MNVRISNQLALEGIPPELYQSLIDTLTLQNPKWVDNVRMNRWNRGVPRYLKFYHRGNQGRLFIPRGYIRQLFNQCRKIRESFKIDDRRRSLSEVHFAFSGALRPFQQRAVKDMGTKEFGTLSAATGSGKTVMALYLIARRRQPALIVVHTKDLAFQWIDRIESFLGVPRAEIGLIGAGKHVIGKRITVSLVQSLYKCADEVSPHIGHLIVDECHRIPSRTFTEAVTEFDAKYMLGLTATPWRRDKLSKLIFWHLGDVHHEVNAGELVRSGDVLSAEVIFRASDFEPFHDPVNEYSQMLTELIADDVRNRMITDDVAEETRSREGVCLVLSDRKHHCENLRALLRYRHRIEADLLTGDLSDDERRDVLERLNNGGVRVLVATGQLIGEGFDCPHLTSLFLTTPIRFSGRVLQYLGRVMRPAPGKETPRVFDYVDVQVGPLVSAAKARQRVYGGKELDKILEDASTT